MLDDAGYKSVGRLPVVVYSTISAKASAAGALSIGSSNGGGTGYQTLIHAALREHLDGKAPRARHDPSSLLERTVMMAGTMATAAYAILSRRKNIVVSLGQSGGEFDFESTVEGLQVLRAGNHKLQQVAR